MSWSVENWENNNISIDLKKLVNIVPCHKEDDFY